MHDGRRWRVDDVPPGPVKALAEIGVLEVHEVVLVEPTDRLERLATHHEAGTREPASHPLDGGAALPAVGGGPRVRRPYPAEARVPNSSTQRRQLASRGVEHPVAGVYPRAQRSGPRPAS